MNITFSCKNCSRWHFLRTPNKLTHSISICFIITPRNCRLRERLHCISFIMVTPSDCGSFPRMPEVERQKSCSRKQISEHEKREDICYMYLLIRKRMNFKNYLCIWEMGRVLKKFSTIDTYNQLDVRQNLHLSNLTHLCLNYN